MNEIKRSIPAAIAVATLWFFPLDRLHAEESKPFSGEIIFEIQNDFHYQSDDPDMEINDLSTTIEVDLNAHVTQPLFVNLHLTTETVMDGGPGEDRTFNDIGTFIEALTVNYEGDGFGVFTGKFGPNFSLAYDEAPGIYGTDMSEDDLELSERIGFGGSLTLAEGEYGTHAASASLFFLDTSPISRSLFTDRGRTRRADGGPSNTESPESFALALDGEDVLMTKGLRYHLGFVRQAVDRVLDDTGAAVADIADEYRAVATLVMPIELQGGVTLTPLVEYAHFWNGGGMANESRDYLTTAASAAYGGWNAALAFTGRFTHAPGGDSNDHQFQVSAGYTFDFGVEADIGWKRLREGGIDTSTFGAFLTYGIEF